MASGSKLHAFSDEIMNAAFKASMELYAEISAKNANWKKVYDDYSKFRADQNLWFRFTEARFDRFAAVAEAVIVSRRHRRSPHGASPAGFFMAVADGYDPYHESRRVSSPRK